MAVGAWGISPRDFYEMTPEEWWLLYEVKAPRSPDTHYAGSLTERDCSELYDLIG